MKLGHQNPVNATAARVVAPGEHFEYSAYANSSDSSLPLPTKPVMPQMLGNPSFEDLTGLISGRLKVIGLSASKSGSWVCRCSCGVYVLRKGRSLREGTAAGAPCDQCYRLALAKKHDHLRQTGRYRGTEKFL